MGRKNQKLITMKIIIILQILSLSFMLSCKAQNSEEQIIPYVIYDKVEQTIYDHIKEYDEFVYFYLLPEKENTTIFIIKNDNYKDSSIGYWVENTNRKILIKDKLYPIVLDSDYKYSTSRPKDIGNYGKRDGSIYKIRTTSTHYYIKFNDKGEIIYQGW